MQDFVLTKSGKEELEKELDYLITVKRPEISEQIKEARAFGDLSENAEYSEARNEQSRNEGRIQELENILRHATIMDDNDINLDRVGIGTKVRILDTEFNDEMTYVIRGTSETDASRNIISNESPVGAALMGHGVGDEVIVKAPQGSFSLRILEISRAE
ncbi:MAG: transcription elongation factor GreA [Clostridia bacterium]|jgi:transcription elongation factor GreA|nr:transcription elongation factor GreA [Clostridia bacterium]MBQ5956536.1 transcription elongation factor GreA [Clostridia bacterium]MBR4623095.1 transcription elongation factor GreA [Clostridia bacterium]MBR6136381.1 transcription elongation factor GreA [Clostridia bacterium]MBR6822284.1 transcription elongation factor GreA [Clostridia bacterium]